MPVGGDDHARNSAGTVPVVVRLELKQTGVDGNTAITMAAPRRGSIPAVPGENSPVRMVILTKFFSPSPRIVDTTGCAVVSPVFGSLARTLSPSLMKLAKLSAEGARTGTPRPRCFEHLTVDEARQLLVSAQGHRLYALFELAPHTGLRKDELLGLHWENLDFDAGTAAIRRTLQRTNTGGLTTLPTKIRASERRIALPTHCLHPLKHHQERQQSEREAGGTTWRHSRPTQHSRRPLTLSSPLPLTSRFHEAGCPAGGQKSRKCL